MSDFYCEKGERVKINKVYDFIIKNSNLNQRQINTFAEIITDTLGLENYNLDEISIEEFDEEFCNYFKNNKSAMKAWNDIKLVMQQNICELWA